MFSTSDGANVRNLVKTLQKDCLEGKILLTMLLRKALVIASKLDISDFKMWVNNELNGYPLGSKMPVYRKTKGKLYGFNPCNGWQPITFPESKEEELITTTYNNQSIAEIEFLQSRADKNDELISPLDGEEELAICKAINTHVPIKRILLNGAWGVMERPTDLRYWAIL